MFASLCCRASCAVSRFQANAARTPATLLAAICSPLPEPPMTMPSEPGSATTRRAGLQAVRRVVVTGGVLGGTDVDHVVTSLGQVGESGGLQLEAGMVGTEVDAHGEQCVLPAVSARPGPDDQGTTSTGNFCRATTARETEPDAIRCRKSAKPVCRFPTTTQAASRSSAIRTSSAPASPVVDTSSQRHAGQIAGGGQRARPVRPRRRPRPRRWRPSPRGSARSPRPSAWPGAGRAPAAAADRLPGPGTPPRAAAGRRRWRRPRPATIGPLAQVRRQRDAVAATCRRAGGRPPTAGSGRVRRVIDCLRSPNGAAGQPAELTLAVPDRVTARPRRCTDGTAGGGLRPEIAAGTTDPSNCETPRSCPVSRTAAPRSGSA